MTFSLICFDVPYLGMIMPFHELLLKLDIVATAGVIMICFTQRKIRIPLPGFILAAALAYVCARTFMCGGSLKSCIRFFIPPVFLCMNVFFAKNASELERIMKIWCAGLTFLLCIDLVTMVLFPSGLYRTEFYTDNWFLGYKTGRLDYTFPLLTMTCFMDIKKNGKLTKPSAVIAFLVIANIARSLATGGTLMLLLFMFLIMILIKGRERRGSTAGKLLQQLNRYGLFLIVYAVLFYCIVIIPTMPFIQDILVNYLHKSADFSGRVPIWQYCLKAIGEHFFLGRGLLTAEDYQLITHGYFNPHNTVIAYMLIGGVAGLSMLAAFMFFPVRATKKDPCCYVFVFYMYIILLLGLISAVLAFSPFLFVMIMIPCCATCTDRSGEILSLLRLQDILSE